MPILLFRVDERLIHGQVVVGWGNALDPDRYAVVDDRLAESDWEQDLYRMSVPDAVEVLFVSVDEAVEALDEWRSVELGTLVLTRDLDSMVRLARRGRLEGEQVNVGGIHHGPGREKVLDYVYLDDEDRTRLRALEEEGVTVTARDLPGTSPVGLGRLLRE